MSNTLALFNADTAVVRMSSKTDKVGSFAKAIAFADRQSRMELSHKIYATQLSNGTYRPLVNDILSSTLLPKAVAEVASALIPSNGPVSKSHLLGLCEYVTKSVEVKRIKAEGNGKQFALKGQNAFLFGLVERLIDTTETIDA
jgi:hypothetical protein